MDAPLRGICRQGPAGHGQACFAGNAILRYLPADDPFVTAHFASVEIEIQEPQAIVSRVSGLMTESFPESTDSCQVAVGHDFGGSLRIRTADLDDLTPLSNAEENVEAAQNRKS